MEDVSLWMYLVLAILVFTGSCVDAIGGGGGIITLPAYLMVGLPPHAAVASNKFSSSIGTAVSTYRYYKRGFCDTGLFIPIILITILGSFIGSQTVLLVPPNILKYVLIGILPFIALFMYNKPAVKTVNLMVNKDRWWMTKLVIIVFCIGFYDGFYGPGTGTFLIIAMTMYLNMDAKHAAGNTKIANLTSNVTALLVFIVQDQICYPLAITGAVFSILGHYVGASLLIHKGSCLVRPVIIIVLVMLFIKVLYDLKVLGF